MRMLKPVQLENMPIVQQLEDPEAFMKALSEIFMKKIEDPG